MSADKVKSPEVSGEPVLNVYFDLDDKNRMYPYLGSYHTEIPLAVVTQGRKYTSLVYFPQWDGTKTFIDEGDLFVQLTENSTADHLGSHPYSEDELREIAEKAGLDITHHPRVVTSDCLEDLVKLVTKDSIETYERLNNGR